MSGAFSTEWKIYDIWQQPICAFYSHVCSTSIMLSYVPNVPYRSEHPSSSHAVFSRSETSFSSQHLTEEFCTGKVLVNSTKAKKRRRRRRRGKKASKKMKNFKSYSTTVFPKTRREKNSKSEITLNNVLKNKTMFSILTLPSRDPMILVRLMDVPSLLLQSVIIFFKHLSNFYYFFFFNFLFCIDTQSINNVVIVSGEQ